MRRDNGDRLNKEKLLFLAATLLTSSAMYVCLSSGPMPLALVQPATREPGPESFEGVPLTRQSKPIDKLVDSGERVSPFEPIGHLVTCGGGGPGGKRNDDPNRIVPIPDHPEKKVVEATPPAIASEVDYVGVVVDGERRALIKPKNGSTPFIVAMGDKIPHYDYRIEKIEPQAIEIIDSEKRTFTLKDQSFEKGARTAAR